MSASTRNPRALDWALLAERTRSAAAALAHAAPRSREALDRFRDQRLRRLVAHAAAEVPFHRARLAEHGVRASDVRGVVDLARLPVVGKPDLQAAGERDLLARSVDPERLIERRTTGSTGQRISIRRSWLEERTLGAYRWRALAALGARRRDRFAEVEEPLGTDSGDTTAVHTWLQRTGLYRQRRIDALAEPAEVLDELVDFDPTIISGYAGVVARAAREALQRGEKRVRPRAIVLHSDTLTAQMRRACSEAFAAPVHAIYDCNECNVVAWECPSTGAFHTSDDTVLVEVLRPDGSAAAPGESGEVVLTSLHSFAMPFLRYRIGDVVVQGDPSCSCGSPFATIRAVQGRMIDYFPLPDGRTLHPYELVNVLGERAPWIAEYRLLQERRDHVRLRYLAHESPTAGQLDALTSGLQGLLGSQVSLRVEAVDGFASEKGPKTRVCRSLVASEYDSAVGDSGGGSS